MILEFDVKKTSIKCQTPDAPKSEEVISYVKCHFNFLEDVWEDMSAVVAIFKSASYNNTAECILDSSNSCYMPVDIYKHGGVIQVILYGDQYTADRKRLISDYIGPAKVFFGSNVVLPIPLPSKYDVFVAEFTNIKTILSELIDNFTDIDDIYLDDSYHLVVKLSNGEVYVSSNSLKGDTGVGIESITKTSTTGLEDTYTILFSDGTSTTYTVINGASIEALTNEDIENMLT